MHLRRNRRGFTLVELMVVIVILGIIGTMAFVFLLDKPDQAKWETTKTQMGDVVKALQLYAVNHDNEYPESLEAISKDFGGKIPEDPFTKQPYLYERDSNVGFLLRCLGKDKQEGGADIPNRDIVFNQYGFVEESQ